MSTIVIKEVTSRSMLKTFIDFPTLLLKHYPAFTPAIFEDELQNLNPKKNPAHRYCDTKLFLAYQNNKVVGRVCGIINHYSNRKYKEKRLRFNRIDFIEDYDVFESLMHGLKTYALANQLDTLVGPLGFSDQDKEGLLTEGFDERNMFVTLYSPSYYVGFFERYGFVKDATWNEYQIKVPLRIPEYLLRVVERIQERYDFRLVTIPKKNKLLLGPYIKKILALMNLTYGHLYGFVPVEEDLMYHLVKQYLPLIQLDFLQLFVLILFWSVGFSRGCWGEIFDSFFSYEEFRRFSFVDCRGGAELVALHFGGAGGGPRGFWPEGWRSSNSAPGAG
jgi:hypothetical protein